MAAPAFQVEMVPIGDIFIVGERRATDAGAVARLTESIAAIGLQTPITVRVDADIVEPETGEVIGGYALVTGRHRLAASKHLGHSHIAAIVRNCDAVDAKLWEIAENLHRAELTALERDEQVALWVKLNAEKVSQPATPGGQQPKFKGIRAAERELGVKRDDASRAVKVAGLTDEAKQAARDAGLDDNRSALLDAAKHDSVADQVAAIRARAELQHKPKIADRPLHDVEALERQVAALMSAWNKASAEARQEFLARIDTPVFDRSAA